MVCSSNVNKLDTENSNLGLHINRQIQENTKRQSINMKIIKTRPENKHTETLREKRKLLFGRLSLIKTISVVSLLL